MNKLSFNQIIEKLSDFWCKQGCTLIQPWDTEIGAGTFHPAFILSKKTNIAFVQPSRRPQDSRKNSPHRLFKHHQFQVLIEPIPENMQDLLMQSFDILGLSSSNYELKFIGDEWKSPSLGSFGKGTEIWANDTEICQFSYFQQIADKELEKPIVEITYGLERTAMIIQDLNNWREIEVNNGQKYSEVFFGDDEFSEVSSNIYDTESLRNLFEIYKKNCELFLIKKFAYPAYEAFLKMSNVFNILEARGGFSKTQRVERIAMIRNYCIQCVECYNSYKN
ncbi:glycine--tRNA ligase subunit alpha [Candidatus Nesciobacter abundans]|uniref:Glycine--tRNA ligase alpha subunit n=1 Tax=Candidatus Nesciobacter abundans TaxID=2601668 RepID=A0A5C0UH44_9PROT|nr:glycine--tRNA ligase subunit alpha [Candidatus Nesciobacter abundans]QEK38991.1 glycine--tRNA ligase subunit alpha [Candidatus Nesciobacter abundans]